MIRVLTLDNIIHFLPLRIYLFIGKVWKDAKNAQLSQLLTVMYNLYYLNTNLYIRMYIYIFICSELIEETGRFRNRIFGI